MSLSPRAAAPEALSRWGWFIVPIPSSAVLCNLDFIKELFQEAGDVERLTSGAQSRRARASCSLKYHEESNTGIRKRFFFQLWMARKDSAFH